MANAQVPLEVEQILLRLLRPLALQQLPIQVGYISWPQLLHSMHFVVVLTHIPHITLSAVGAPSCLQPSGARGFRPMQQIPKCCFSHRQQGHKCIGQPCS